MSFPKDTPTQAETPVEPGSIPLKNAKWEKFAHRLSWGVEQGPAYVLAGYPDTPTKYTNASRLAKTPIVSQRADWLRLQIAQAHVYDAAKIRGRLAEVADALSEIRINPDTGEREPGPMFNATAAKGFLELLGRAEGLFKDRIELGGKVQVANREVFERMTPVERQFMKELLVKARDRAPTPANDDAPQAEEEPAQAGVVPIVLAEK